MAKKQIKQPKYVFAAVKRFEGDELVAVASTGALDRENEIIEPGAWRESLDLYRTNPVILASHQHRLATGNSPVIGSAHQIGVEADALLFRMRFAGTALGTEYRQLYSEGHMRAFSVGFMPREGQWRDADREDGGTTRVWAHTRVELYEISAVAVPANPEALAAMRAAGVMGGSHPAAVAATIAGEVVLALMEYDLAGKLAQKLTPPDVPLVELKERPDLSEMLAQRVMELINEKLGPALEAVADARDDIAILLPPLDGGQTPPGESPPPGGAGGRPDRGGADGADTAARSLMRACRDTNKTTHTRGDAP